MGAYIEVRLVFENKHIVRNPKGFAKDIERDLAMIFKTKMVIEPEVWTVEVLDVEDDDADL